MASTLRLTARGLFLHSDKVEEGLHLRAGGGREAQTFPPRLQREILVPDHTHKRSACHCCGVSAWVLRGGVVSKCTEGTYVVEGDLLVVPAKLWRSPTQRYVKTQCFIINTPSFNLFHESS